MLNTVDSKVDGFVTNKQFKWCANLSVNWKC